MSLVEKIGEADFEELRRISQHNPYTPTKSIFAALLKGKPESRMVEFSGF